MINVLTTLESRLRAFAGDAMRRKEAMPCFLPCINLGFGDLSSDVLISVAAARHVSAEGLAETFLEGLGRPPYLSSQRGRINVRFSSPEELYAEGSRFAARLPAERVVEVVCEKDETLSGTRHHALALLHAHTCRSQGWDVLGVHRINPDGESVFSEVLAECPTLVFLWGSPGILTGRGCKRLRAEAAAVGAAVSAVGYTADWSGARMAFLGGAQALERDIGRVWYLASPLPAAELDAVSGPTEGRFPLAAYAQLLQARLRGRSVDAKPGEKGTFPAPHTLSEAEARELLHRAVFLPGLISAAAVSGDVRGLVGLMHRYLALIDSLLAAEDPVETLTQLTGAGASVSSCIHGSLAAMIALNEDVSARSC